MSNLTDYTSYGDVRSLLGATVKELPDTILAMPHFAVQADLDLSDIDGGVGQVATQYDAIKGLQDTAWTSGQRTFYFLARQFYLYSVGLQLARADKMWSVQKVADGRALMQRQTGASEQMQNALQAGWNNLRARLAAALAVLVPSAAVAAAPDRVYILAAPTFQDPVTGA